LHQIWTPYGNVRVKVSSYGDGISRSMPEYADCRRLAADAKVPLGEIMNAVIRATHQHRGMPRKKTGGMKQ
jgi:uncharacterized protein (DUF111 family)